LGLVILGASFIELLGALTQSARNPREMVSPPLMTLVLRKGRIDDQPSKTCIYGWKCGFEASAMHVDPNEFLQARGTRAAL